MQSGISNARGMTHGWLAARHACGDPSKLLEQEIARLGCGHRMSETTPSVPGGVGIDNIWYVKTSAAGRN